MNTTHKDIAKRLQISSKSVARVLSGGPVSDKMRERVICAAQELSYHENSNSAARVLAAKRYGKPVRHGVIGCVRDRCDDAGRFPYWMELQTGIQEAAAAQGFSVMMLAGDAMRNWEKVDGVLVHSDGAPFLYKDLPIPIPFVSIMTPAPGVPSVLADDASGIRQAVGHLVALGHRRIGYLIHTENNTPVEAVRLGAYHEALRTNGIALGDGWVYDLENCGDFFARGRHSMKLWLENGFRDTGITALLVQNDHAAMGAMAALHDAKVRVPQDLSVIGFDGKSECEVVRPNLSSVHVPLLEIGAKAVELLLGCILDERIENLPVALPVHLQVRESTAAPSVCIKS